MNTLEILMLVIIGLYVVDAIVFYLVFKKTQNTNASVMPFSGFYELYKYLNREK